MNIDSYSLISRPKSVSTLVNGPKIICHLESSNYNTKDKLDLMPLKSPNSSSFRD